MIYLGADHGGFKLKEKIKRWLDEWGFRWEDCGNTFYNQKDDYPEFAFKVAKKVTENELKKAYPKPWRERSKGVLACRSAAGMVIASAKVKGARPVAAFGTVGAEHSRRHNDTNILALSGDFISDREVKKILKVWLETEFSGEERHKRRLKQIEEYEKKQERDSNNPL